MRRADRLFQIIQILRRDPRPVTADRIAAEREISRRSVYRDIADLIGQRVPIRGEAGLGYVLEGGFDLPPLMFTADEIEAAVLGAQWVRRHGDPALAAAAVDLIAKLGAAVPERLRSYVLDPLTAIPPASAAPPAGADLGALRTQIRAGRKLKLGYRDEQARRTDRIVWPVAIGYLDMRRILVGWCELRDGFRHFRMDRIVEVMLMEDRYPVRPALLRAQWRRGLQAENRDREQRGS